MLTATVQAMSLTPKQRLVRINLNDSERTVIRMPPVEVQCRDIRVGDTVQYIPDLAKYWCSIVLERRSPEAVPFTC